MSKATNRTLLILQILFIGIVVFTMIEYNNWNLTLKNTNLKD